MAMSRKDGLNRGQQFWLTGIAREVGHLGSPSSPTCRLFYDVQSELGALIGCRAGGSGDEVGGTGGAQERYASVA